MLVRLLLANVIGASFLGNCILSLTSEDLYLAKLPMHLSLHIVAVIDYRVP